MKTPLLTWIGIVASLTFLVFPPGAVAQAPHDLENRCTEIQFTQPDFGSRTPAEIKAFLDSQDIAAGVRDFVSTRVLTNPWFTLKVPHAYPRTIGIYQGIQFAFGMYGVSQELGTSPEEWINQALAFFSAAGLERARTLTPLSSVLGPEMSPEQMRASLLVPRSYDESGLGAMMHKHPSLVRLSCLKIDPSHKKDCASAIQYTYKNLYDSGETFNIGNGWLVDLLPNNHAEVGGFRLVRRMLERLRTGDYSGASLIDDAYASFDDRKTAETFLLMGLIHGQLSFESYRAAGFVQPYNFSTIVAAHVMSMLSAALDYQVYAHSPERRTYVSPVGMRNVCDNGKPYHFLVPWYIARRLAEKSYNQNIQSKVSFLFDWMYQNFSTSLGRDPLVNARSAYDTTVNQSHRVDLLFSAAGANLGSAQASREVDFTHAFNSTQDQVSTSVQAPQNVKEPRSGNLRLNQLIKLFKIGDKRFSPNALLESTR